MTVLTEATAERAERTLERMVGPVVLRLPEGDETTRALAEELAALQPLLEVEQGEGERLSVLDGWGRETGIHFEGPPLGQELDALLDAVLAVSRGVSPLTPLARAQAGGLQGDLWVFTTPTCPRCAQAVRLAHAIALESRGALRATAIDVSRRPELIAEYGAQTVPFFVVDGRHGFPGPLPELLLVQRIADLTAS